MPTIKRECIEHIRAAADLYDIVSSYVQLKRSGGNWKGLSPFTVEKTPSFFVLPEKKFFKCFSTGYAGDVFRFLELKENFAFLESVEWLAKRYGISIEYEEDRSPKSYSKNELFDLHEEAIAYYRKKFFENTQIQGYWKNIRQFSLEVAERYEIGWAPAFDRELLFLLRKKKYSEEALQRCGLFMESENNRDHLKPRFSGRLMIPIRDVQDRAIGFSGRIVEKKESVSKYINSPESPIFHKGSVFYGLNRARKFIADRFVIVEGQLDAIRCWESGIPEAIAPQGTGITEMQMNLLRRYGSKLLCFMDGDSAGQKCALRIVELSFKVALESQIATLSEGDDPDSLLLREGKIGFDRLKRESMIQFASRVLLAQGREATALEKEAFLKKMYEMIHLSESEVTKGIYLDELASHLNLDRNAIGSDFCNFCGDGKFVAESPMAQPQREKKKETTKLQTAEYDLLSLILRYENLGKKVAYLIDDAWISPHEHGQLLLKVLNEIRENMWEGLQNDSLVFSEPEINELFSILAEDNAVEDYFNAANTCMRSLCMNFAKNKLEDINKKASQQRKFTRDKNSLDNFDFFKNLQDEKIRLRQLLASCPKVEA
ncbi:MAG: DNA primase [Puniceicoccales bacterium]|jgi:DNA primase|nr:DNA primase [Puniceicoccales bacterium]